MSSGGVLAAGFIGGVADAALQGYSAERKALLIEKQRKADHAREMALAAFKSNLDISKYNQTIGLGDTGESYKPITLPQSGSVKNLFIEDLRNQLGNIGDKSEAAAYISAQRKAVLGVQLEGTDPNTAHARVATVSDNINMDFYTKEGGSETIDVLFGISGPSRDADKKRILGQTLSDSLYTKPYKEDISSIKALYASEIAKQSKQAKAAGTDYDVLRTIKAMDARATTALAEGRAGSSRTALIAGIEDVYNEYQEEQGFDNAKERYNEIMEKIRLAGL